MKPSVGELTVMRFDGIVGVGAKTKEPEFKRAAMKARGGKDHAKPYGVITCLTSILYKIRS